MKRISDEILAKAIEFQDVPEVKLVLIDLRDARAALRKAKKVLEFYATASVQDYAAALSEQVDIGQRARGVLKELTDDE